LGLVNPREKFSDVRENEERFYHPILHYFMILRRELEGMAEMELRKK
jgi:hypothetical protein